MDRPDVVDDDGVHWMDMGSGVLLSWLVDTDERMTGLVHRHPRPDGTPCGSSAIMLDVPGAREDWPDLPLWSVERWDPLTLSPSVLCRACGAHGWVREGRWVEA